MKIYNNYAIEDASILLEYNLQYFAQGDSGGDKTEQPTSKKLNDARKEGQVAKSKELTNATGLILFFLIIKIFVGFMSSEFIKSFKLVYRNMGMYASNDTNVRVFNGLFINMLLKILFICLPVFIITMTVDIVLNILQVKWKVSTKPMKPKLSKINPFTGFKRIFSKEKMMELVTSILKFLVILIVSYNTIKKEWNLLYSFYDIELDQAIILIGTIVLDLGINVSMVFLVIGIGDFFYQKFKFKKDMMMTKQEVKEEYKESEGDPQIKSKIKSRMMEASRRRMMQAIKEADVVITNPTHFAAAIKYDKEISDAPILLAKGADYLANKIKEEAKEHKIEIVENKPLARMLYYNVEIGDEIPPELYQMTAEVLAYVYGLKND